MWVGLVTVLPGVIWSVKSGFSVFNGLSYLGHASWHIGIRWSVLELLMLATVTPTLRIHLGLFYNVQLRSGLLESCMQEQKHTQIATGL